MTSSVNGRVLDEDMDNQIVQAVCVEDGIGVVSGSIGMSDFSDEILLSILRYVSTSDLVNNVSRTCRKLHTLCYDKTLLTTVTLSEEYTADDGAIRQVLKHLSNHVQSLSLSGCYWLSGSTIDRLIRCRSLVRLDLSGCRVTSLRLSRLLSSLPLLRSLAFDVSPGFDSAQLSGEARDSLSRLSELRQTVLTPSYGVVPCCSSLFSLQLQLDILDVTREGTSMCCQLMMGQSSVPHYQQLEEFTACLAPGEVNQTLLLLYLAVFSVRVPERLHSFLVSVPGPNPAHWPAASSLAHSLVQHGDLEALQLPRSWLDATSLGRVLLSNAPKHLNFSRCPTLRQTVIQSLTGTGVRDSTRLVSLNLSGIGHTSNYPECSRARGEEELVAEAMSRLVICCPNLSHLNLLHTHYHHDNAHTPGLEANTHLCTSLSKLTHLRSLALPACALSDGSHTPSPSPSPSSLLLGLRKPSRVGLQTYRPGSGDSLPREGTSGLGPLLAGCPCLEVLEITGPGFISALPRLEPCARVCVDQRTCVNARGVGDTHVAALRGFRGLRRLTLAGLPGVLKGTGLVQVAEHCRDLQALSLANLGSLKTWNYSAALLDTLRNCTQLTQLRLEQPYLVCNGAFWEALSCCSRLRRLCLISRNGTFHPAAVVTFMECCRDVMMCHMFLGGTLVACRTLQKTLLDRFSVERPALSVVIYPLLHEDLPLVIRDMPLPLLDQLTLFQSRVAQAPPSSQLGHQRAKRQLANQSPSSPW
ncbi:F-box/LRR-repeat protein 18 isoform X1 [Oncorhynchus kisutch]|uniref:F-box and leucine rich repeat protein 18 n=2 Tax=Oncorhynchus kisutch TaxID=8019 RepID=A0A8C7MPN2_ONCKI|nr:F-box/LRR-repeat protein 18 isoform X1 [Oncorhynchus kisutch]